MSNTISHFWSSPLRHFIYSRWTVIVLLNAMLPFFLSLEFIRNITAFTGIMLAVASFVVIYAELESWLLRQRYTQLAKQLKLAASIKIATIIYVFIDMIIGAIAIETTRWLTGINVQKVGTYDSSFINLPELAASYITTMIDGFLLSIIVALLIMVIRGIIQLRRYFKGAPN